jgi:hypothetical protein
MPSRLGRAWQPLARWFGTCGRSAQGRRRIAVMASTEDTNGMKPTELIEACMKQAEYFAQRCDVRTSYQWKVTLGLWTAILLAIGKVWGTGDKVPGSLLAFLLFAYTMVWVRGIYVNNRIDSERARHFRCQAEDVLTGNRPTIIASPPLMSRSSWRWRFGFTVVWAHTFEVM